MTVCLSLETLDTKRSQKVAKVLKEKISIEYYTQEKHPLRKRKKQRFFRRRKPERIGTGTGEE